MQLSKIIFLCAIAGVMILLALPQFLEPEKLSLNQSLNFSMKNLNKQILVQGTLESVRCYPTEYSDNLCKIHLKNSKQDFTLFSNKNLNSTLIKNTNITIEGRLDFYKNQTQIIVDRISIPAKDTQLNNTNNN
jgi:RecG-like helicase